MKKDITVVLPVYNAAEYIEETLDSIINQTFEGNIEVLIINDGSEDDSMNVVSEYISKKSRDNIEFNIFDDGENKGPGYRRNFGIKHSKGQAIQFLDSDDILMPDALRLGFEKLVEDDLNSFVTYEWAYYYDETGKTVYSAAEVYDQFDLLSGRGCEMLVRSSSFFTVHKLYSANFLKDNEIYYGEGYIYEDVEFFVKAAIRAKRIPTLSNLLYKVRVHSNSITKTNSDSMEHYNSYLIAMRKSYEVLLDGTRNELTPYYLSRYFIRRAVLYSERRLPNNKQIKYSFLKESLKIVSEYNPNLVIPKSLSPYYNQIFKSEIIKNNDVKSLLKITKELKKGSINYYNFRQKKKKARANERKLLFTKWKSKIENNYYLNPLVYKSRKIVHKKRAKKKHDYNLEIKNIGIKNQVVMLGFDYKYTGNSRYLFEYLKTKYTGDQLKFVTNDMRVPKEYRVTPRSDNFFKVFYSSKIVIAESWVPRSFEKIEGQKWIQLWHGTPLKKLLFDTHESSLLRLNPNHRVRKKEDIERWDYLLADTVAGSEKLQSAFDISKEKILIYGYPRNEFLVKNRDNEELKLEIKRRYHLPLDKKILLYVPTWRDYNYKQVGKKIDLSYQLNLNFLLSQLGDEYIVINKGHSMDSRKNKSVNPSVIENHNAMEIQELILVSDIIITDYSSTFYDGIHIEKPFYLITKDTEKFEHSRGAYEDFMDDVKAVTFSSDFSLSNAIYNDKFKNLSIKDKYKNNNLKSSSEMIYKLISKFV